MNKKKSTEENTIEEVSSSNNQENELIEEANSQSETEYADNNEVTNEQSSEKSTKSELEEMSEKLSAMQDKHIRLIAEFDNYKKRTFKEKTDLIKSAGESILVGILPIVDDFERAMQAMQTSDDIAITKEGTLLIYNKMKAFLTQNGVKEIEAKDKPFDTDLHEAITKFPAPSDDMKGKVVEVVEKGYLLNEKIIRYSKVVIGE
ncbi:MAG: nucleotide exchange factor GrpE [Bacteroidales bacterium]|nr:nucleotide exchange factor GrpE [Bacteroidales bacterium]